MTVPHPRPYASVLDTIGWTPLIQLARIGQGLRTPIYGKAEYANPGGSVKDRIGLAIIGGMRSAPSFSLAPRDFGVVMRGRKSALTIELTPEIRADFANPDRLNALLASAFLYVRPEYSNYGGD